MKLFYIPGACSMATHIMLREMKEDFELEAVDPAKGVTETGREFKAINPKGYVPVLELSTGDFLTEGVAVLTYLSDGAVDGKGDRLLRARILESLTYTASELHKSFSPLFNDKSTEAQKAFAIKAVHRKFDYLESLFADGREFVVGSDFTVADAYLFVVVNWSNFKDINLGAWPNLSDYISCIGSRPTVVAAMHAEGLGQ